MSTNYAGNVQRSVRAASAWRMACMVMTLAVLVLAGVAMHASGVQRTVLVPYGLMSANNAVKINGHPVHDHAYLALLARADIATLLDWQPKTVDKQLDAILARFTPAAYARYNLDLRNKAKKFAGLNVSETFYLKKIKFEPPNKIVLEGQVQRYTGDRLSTNAPATYTLTYSISSGIYAIDKVETQQ